MSGNARRAAKKQSASRVSPATRKKLKVSGRRRRKVKHRPPPDDAGHDRFAKFIDLQFDVNSE